MIKKKNLLDYKKEFITKEFETNSKHFSEWFGYYNYDVMDASGKKMLCGRVSFDGRSISDNDTVELGWYNIENGEWNFIGKSDSFNWQQGAMLQWIPNEKNKVAYNFSNKKHFLASIIDISSKHEFTLPFPIYCITPDGKQSISLNYERSYWCRAYHYAPIKNKKYDCDIAEDDGIFSVDLQTGEVKRIVAIQDVIKNDWDPCFDDAKHWFEHIMINKSGTRIVFLHRFITKGSLSYNTRICLADIDGKNLKIIQGWKNKLWSHFGWKSDDSFVIYCQKRNKLQFEIAEKNKKQKRSGLKSIVIKVVKKIIPQFIRELFWPKKSFYEQYDLINGNFVRTCIYDQKIFNIDGHPSFTKDGKYMITDSYPDKSGYQHLIVFNTETKKGIVVAKIFAALSNTPASCDLHPKLCFNDSKIVVDSAYTGVHKMLVFNINWEAIRKKIS